MALHAAHPVLLLLLLLPSSALSSKCSAPSTASYPDLISAGTQPCTFHTISQHQHSSTGNAAFSKQSFDVAEACYSRASALEPKQPLAVSNRALAVMNQGRNDEALKVSFSSHEPNIRKPSNLSNVIVWHVAETARLQLFHIALKLDRKSADTYHALGSLLHNMGNDDDEEYYFYHYYYYSYYYYDDE
jgi:hypothetical protein